MKRYLLLLALWPVYAQAQSLQVGTGTPQNVTASASYHGATGVTAIYYYICTRYPSGYTCMSQPVVANRTPGISNLGGQNYSMVNWAPGIPQATGYDVIRMATGGSFNGTCTACAVLLNTHATSYIDASSGPGSNYPPNGLNPASGASGVINLDNLDYNTPGLGFTINGLFYPFGLVPPGVVPGYCAVFQAQPPFLAGVQCSGSGGINQLHGDVTAGPGVGNQLATVVGLESVPFCTGYTPANGQAVTLTTGSSPNPCYTAVTPTGTLSFESAPTSTAIVTDYDATHIQTPNGTTTIDGSGNLFAQGSLGTAGALNVGIGCTGAGCITQTHSYDSGKAHDTVTSGATTGYNGTNTWDGNPPTSGYFWGAYNVSGDNATVGWQAAAGCTQNCTIGATSGNVALTVTGDSSGDNVVNATSTSGGAALNGTVTDTNFSGGNPVIAATVTETDNMGSGQEIQSLFLAAVLNGSNVAGDTLYGAFLLSVNNGSGTAGTLASSVLEINNTGTADNAYGSLALSPTCGTIISICAAYEADSGWPFFLYTADASTKELFGNLAGSGTRMVTATSTGQLGTATIPTGGITQLTGPVTAGPGSGSQATTIASSINLPGSPTTTTQAALTSNTTISTTAYTDAAVAAAIAGVNPAVAVRAATTTAANTSSLTYNNGVSGVGATFTGANNTALTVDGFTFSALGQRLLVKNDTQSPSGAFNGIYSVTQLQATLLPVILTRALDYDQPSDMNNTGAIPVVSGTANAGTSWLLTSSVTTVGTSPLTYTQFTLSPTTLVTGTGSVTAGHVATFVSSGTSYQVQDGGAVPTGANYNGFGMWQIAVPVSSNFTAFNTSSQTITSGTHFLSINSEQSTGGGSHYISGMHTACPAAPWTIWALISIVAPNSGGATNTNVGIEVDDGTKYVTVGPEYPFGSSQILAAFSFSNSSTFNATIGDNAYQMSNTPIWYYASNSGGTLTLGYSIDGTSLTTLGTSTYLSANTNCGMFADNSNANNGVIADVYAWNVFNTAGASLVAQ